MRKKLQYRYEEYYPFQRIIKLYHDGELTEAYKVYADKLFDEIEKLEEQGYSRGYTKEEVAEAKERYEVMLKNVI
jgi:hypothetical protein